MDHARIGAFAAQDVFLFVHTQRYSKDRICSSTTIRYYATSHVVSVQRYRVLLYSPLATSAVGAATRTLTGDTCKQTGASKKITWLARQRICT